MVQGTRSNYDTDLFAPILASVEKLSGKKYGGRWDSIDDAAMRVVADHARATAFLVADGVMPSNEGRGSVLRRIMRRAIRHGEQHLNLDTVFFGTCVEAVIEAMKGSFAELHEKRAFILEVAKHEEESFRRTLVKGRKRFGEEIARLEKEGSKAISGEAAWDLHQTYGFPVDLTQIMGKELGYSVDIESFDAIKKAAADGPAQLTAEKGIADIYMKLVGELGDTKFLGYEGDGLTGTAKVLAIVGKAGQVTSANAGDQVELVFDATPFYGESGGQVGDTGTAISKGAQLTITDTQKPTGALFVHHAKVTSGTVSVGDQVELKVDGARRNMIRANHSATHLLHKALKVVLGEAVNQKGSIVGPDSLRFDFSHFSQVTADELDRVEDLVNGWVRDNDAAQTRVMNLAEAKAAGAVALFGEKYGEKVRVVTVHHESTELCGGTHVSRSGDIGLFKVTQESSVAAGVRRIVALTGAAAFTHLREQEKQLKRAADLFKAPTAELTKRIEAVQKRAKDLERKVEEVTLNASSGGGKAETVTEVNGVKVLTQRVDPADANVLRQLADRHRDHLKSGIIALGGQTADGKALILVAATRDVVEKGFKAGAAIGVMAPEIGGKGGGKPDMAQAGGSDASKIPQAFEKLLAMVKGS